MGLQNTAASSWIQINGTIHDFVAGDIIHEHASLICDMLDRLIREVGLVANNHDMKEEFVR